jgi:hypothetical protein
MTDLEPTISIMELDGMSKYIALKSHGNLFQCEGHCDEIKRVPPRDLNTTLK